MATRDDGFDDIRRAIRRRYGETAAIENIVVPTLGGSNRTVIFDLVDGSARRRLVTRQETTTGEASPFLSTAHQFRVMRLAFDRGFPVPEPVFEFDAGDRLGNGYVTAFVAGETMPKKLITGADFATVRPHLAGRFGELLALLHSIELTEIGFLNNYPDSVDPIAAERARFDRYVEPHPAIELGLRWLERNRPAASRPVLAHGDFRVGNIMITPEGVTAVLDWECAHIGTSAQDLGWLCTRSWRFSRPDLAAGGVGTREELIRAYEGAGGDTVDREAVRYWEIFGLVRWAILNVWQGYGHVFGGRRSVVYAACGRNTSLVEYEILMTLAGHYD